MSLLVSHPAPPQTPAEAKPPAHACSLLYLHQLLGGERGVSASVCSRGAPAAQRAQDTLAEQQWAGTARAVPEARTMRQAWDGDEDQNHDGSRADVGPCAISLAGGHPQGQRKGEACVATAVLQQGCHKPQLPGLHLSVPCLVPWQGAPIPVRVARPRPAFGPPKSCWRSWRLEPPVCSWSSAMPAPSKGAAATGTPSPALLCSGSFGNN